MSQFMASFIILIMCLKLCFLDNNQQRYFINFCSLLQPCLYSQLSEVTYTITNILCLACLTTTSLCPYITDIAHITTMTTVLTYYAFWCPCKITCYAHNISIITIKQLNTLKSFFAGSHEINHVHFSVCQICAR